MAEGLVTCLVLVVVMLLASSGVADAWAQQQQHQQRRHHPAHHSPLVKHTRDDTTKDNVGISRRRVSQQLLTTSIMMFGTSLVQPTSPAVAGEIGARINAAVTKSDLGISVRRSVVKGAQFMDGVDGQWEQFSDRFGLGANRGRQADKPAPKVIPPPQPLDGTWAAQVLQASDDIFCALTKTSQPVLQQQIAQITSKVGPSFERSGLQVQAVVDAKGPRNGDEFNFLAYTRFKAYTNLIVQEKIDFGTFQKAYEDRMGAQVQALLIGNNGGTAAATAPSNNATPVVGSLSDPRVRQARWTALQARLQRLGDALVQRGLVAQMDVSYDADDLADWLDDDEAVSDLQFNIALDGDVTLPAQILLQEQGFRFYPNFGRFAIRNALQETLGTRKGLEMTDYYMDTDYNSDPDKFQVKEVLLSIVLESN